MYVQKRDSMENRLVNELLWSFVERLKAVNKSTAKPLEDQMLFLNFHQGRQLLPGVFSITRNNVLW